MTAEARLPADACEREVAEPVSDTASVFRAKGQSSWHLDVGHPELVYGLRADDLSGALEAGAIGLEKLGFRRCGPWERDLRAQCEKWDAPIEAQEANP